MALAWVCILSVYACRELCFALPHAPPSSERKYRMCPLQLHETLIVQILPTENKIASYTKTYPKFSTGQHSPRLQVLKRNGGFTTKN
ncbi:hypothetical protein C8R43DRAFT_175967 [Mycena crocata]|nr:hypothetical protein C8R43DRAFT_175967 [Mycena crocata]